MTAKANWPSGEIGSISEFIDALEFFSEASTHVFRGQSKTGWPLEPSLDRKAPCGTTYKDRLNEERELIERFRCHAGRYLGSSELSLLERFPSGDCVAAMTVVQHFGGPTRLLDWTRSFLVAAYFACIEHWDEDGNVWWFNSKALDERLRGQWAQHGFSSSDNIDYNDRIFDESVPSFIGPVYFTIPFQRAKAQSGLFTISGRLGELHDQLLSEVLPASAYGKIIIRSQLKQGILRELGRRKVNAISLEDVGADRIGTRFAWELDQRRSKARKSYSPSPEALQQSVHLVLYEIEMFVGCCVHWRNGVPRDSAMPLSLRNAIIESTLLHMRALLEFFEPAPRYKDTVLCGDAGFPASPITVPSSVRDRLNQDLAHVTYSRLNRPGLAKAWKLADFGPVWDRCRDFVRQALTDPNLAEDVQQSLRALEEPLCTPLV